MEYIHKDIDPTQFDYTTAYREFGNGKYLASGETFEEVVARDKAILDAYGVTYAEVGQSLRKLLRSFNMFLRHRQPAPQFPIPGIKMGCQIFELGQEFCPYIKDKSSNIDWHIWVDGLNNGNKAYHPVTGATIVSNMLPEMIEQLGFFEGTLYYGIQPEWAVAVHKLVEHYDPKPYLPIYTKRAWSGLAFLGSLGYFHPGNEKMYRSYKEMRGWWKERGNIFPPEVIKKHIIHKEDIADGVKAFVTPGDLELSLRPYDDGKRDSADTRKSEYLALLVAYKDCRVAPETTLLGLPFDMYSPGISGSLKKGEMWIYHMWPYTDKQVA